MKTKRGVFTVMERPGQEETPMDVEPSEASLEEYVHVGRTPNEAEPMEGTTAGAKPVKEAPVDGVAGGDAGGGVARAEDARERRPELVENIVERQIGGRTFRLGRLLS